MLSTRMMMGAAGVIKTCTVSNASLLDLACTSAEFATWTQNDNYGALASAVTDAPVASPAATAWKFDGQAEGGNNNTTRYKDIGSIEGLGNRIVLSFKVYCDLIGTHSGADYSLLYLQRSDWNFWVRLCSDWFIVDTSSGQTHVSSTLIVQDVWQEWSFDIDLSNGVENATCDVYLDNILKLSSLDCNSSGGTDGVVALGQYSMATAYQLSYFDWVKIGNGFT